MKSLAVVLLFCTVIAADVIYTTGEGVVAPGGASISTSFNYAAQFTLSEDYAITDVFGWLNPKNGDMAISLHKDLDELPGGELFTSTVSFHSNQPTSWYGATGLDWNIDAGTYWISFVGLSYISAQAPSGNTNAIGFTEADKYAMRLPRRPWTDIAINNAPLGLRIEGYSTSVPEPATVSFLIISLLGLCVSKKKKSIHL